MSETKKRSIADYFKEYPRIVPAKRPSPSSESGTPQQDNTAAKRSDLRTPTTASRFKNVSISPLKSPFGSGSVKIPIRTPQHKPTQPLSCLSNPLDSPSFSEPSSPLSEKPRDPSPRVAQPFLFSDLPHSAKAVIEGGQVVAVKDSDEDDTDSLESLTDIFGRKKDDAVTSDSSPPDLDAEELEAERAKSLFQFTNGRSQPLIGRDKLRELIAKEKLHKFNISSLVEAELDDQEIEGRVAKAKEGYAESEQEGENADFNGKIDKNLLASVIAEGSGEDVDVARLLTAVERTEALALDLGWNFFSPATPSQSLSITNPFPVHTIRSRPEYQFLKESDSRSSAFLSGYISELWRKDKPPSEVVQWTINQAVVEPQKELQRSYIHALEGYGSKWGQLGLKEDVARFFIRLGACPEAVKVNLAIQPSGRALRNVDESRLKQLFSTIETLVALTPYMHVTSVCALLAILSKATLDVSLMSDCRLSIAIENGIAFILLLSNHETSFDALFIELANSLSNSRLQAQMLKHILCISPQSTKLRLKLAQSFLYSDRLPASRYPPLSGDLPKLTSLLDHPDFRTSVHSSAQLIDYSSLSALTYILDVVIADGGRPVDFASRSDEVTFNRKVDVLADRVRALFASIADSGASHMSRTEAKEALQALHYRLLYAVRTEPRPKKNMFGGRSGEEYRAEERGQGFLAKFLARKRKDQTLPATDR